MKYVLMLMMVLALAFHGSAGQREDALLQGLLGFGARALETQAPKPAPTDAEAAEPESASAPSSLGLVLTSSLKPALDGIINEYKEQYKEEGRAYAREVGDIVVTRVVEDPEINSTITSLRTLCWAVVAYLTLVTFIMLGCLVYLKNANARLLAEVRRMARNK